MRKDDMENKKDEEVETNFREVSIIEVEDRLAFSQAARCDDASEAVTE
ncbi:MAG TPA: hypothetical protein VGQ78_10785 [Vicinamibacteria bacterium]|jgi:hypothetical protein|nr:hypothetical protein [Vicinamibacteria bacterium]